MLDVVYFDELDVVCFAIVIYEDRFITPVAKVLRQLLKQNRRSQMLHSAFETDRWVERGREESIIKNHFYHGGGMCWFELVQLLDQTYNT